MGRSQRHMLVEQGTTAAGEIHAQGVVAPGIAAQVDPSQYNVIEPGPASPPYTATKDPTGPGESVTVPTGAPGGPLAGSSLTGAIPEDAIISPPSPEEPPVVPDTNPTLTLLDPASVAVGAANFEMHVHGSNFTPTSVVVFNGTEQSTSFISDIELATVVDSSTATDVATVPVLVREGSFDTPPSDFNFTAAGGTVTEPTTPPAERTLPLGPVMIGLVEDHQDGIQLTMTDPLDVRVGDTVLVEATGNTTINGSYPVLSILDLAVVVDNPVELLTPIEAKGRLTVTG